MSLGFLTESALLPSKGKKIEVDDSSLVGLKALIFEQEEKLRLAREAAGDGTTFQTRGQRGKRSAAAAMLDSDGRPIKKDVFTQSNPGMQSRADQDERNKADSLMTLTERERKAERTMKAKAKLYKKLARKEVGGANAGGLLVDFSDKTPEQLERLEQGGLSSDDEETGYGSDDVDIQDEFGRDIVVKRGSKEHLAYKRHLAQQQQTAAHAAGRISDDPRFAPSPRHIGDERSTGQWAWSSGKASEPAPEGRRRKNSEETLAGRKNMEALIASMGGGAAATDDTGSETGNSSARTNENRTTHFRLKDRWDTKLDQQDKDYIKELREQAAGAKAREEERHAKGSKAERLELLRRKAEERKAKALGGA